jgi:hypothetical protein
MSLDQILTFILANFLTRDQCEITLVDGKKIIGVPNASSTSMPVSDQVIPVRIDGKVMEFTLGEFAHIKKVPPAP